MENATKALMIAAAVIVVLLIIGLGIGVFNMASEQVDNAGDLSEYQIEQINAKFRKYEGDRVSGSDVNALLTTVFNHNNAQPDTTTCVQVEVTAVDGHEGIDASNTLSASPERVSTGNRYDVSLTYNTTNRLVETITIAEPEN